MHLTKPTLLALLGLCGCLSATIAFADPVTVTGTGLVSARPSGGPLTGAQAVYSLSPSQGEIDPLMVFDTSAYAGMVESDGTLTLTVTRLHDSGAELITSLSVYALASAYDASSPVFATISPLATNGGDPANASLIETVAIDTTGTGAVTFTVPEATVEAWADSPSTNYGLVFVQSATWTDSVGNFHSDIQFASSGDAAPSLTFDVPEPASIALLGTAIVGLAMRRRTRRT